jgi:hypothetical protein
MAVGKESQWHRERALILEWMIYHVPDYFSVGVSGQSLLPQQPGFRGQIGGFNMESANPQACTLSFWSDVRTYVKFMDQERDSALVRYQQRKREMIEVSLFNAAIEFPGEFKSVLECLGNATVLRVADCQVKADRQDHFVTAEKDVWIPGMRWRDGMFAGVFSKALNSPSRFLVSTLWKDLDAQASYHLNVVPNLSEIANPGEDVRNLTLTLVKLEPSWLVAPSGDRVVKPMSVYHPVLR